MAEYLSNPNRHNYVPSPSPPSSPTPWDGSSNNSDNESLGDSPWKLESDPYSANAKATHSPLRHTTTKRQVYGIPLTPSSSFTNYGPGSPSPVLSSNFPTLIRVQSKYTPTDDPIWEKAMNDVFHNGATIIDLDKSDVTNIPRDIIDLNKMISLPSEPFEPAQLPPVQPPEIPSHPNIASAAARSRRILSQSRSNNSLFFSRPPSKSKREVQLYLGNNSITTLPSELFQLNNLTLLSLRGNKLRTLPPAIGNLKSLRSLNIANNELTTLPSELSYLNLQTLLLDPNPFLPKPATDSARALESSCAGNTSLRVRELGPLMTHTRIPKLTELALRAALRPASDQQPRIPPLSFTTPNKISDTYAFKSLLTPTDSQSSAFSFPTHTPSLSRSNSEPNPYESRTFPPHALDLEKFYNLTLWLSEQFAANTHIEAVRYGTEDACKLYSWCPSPKHRVDAGSKVSNGIFVLPAEERLEWVTMLAGCQLSSAVPILWRGCSAGCLSFLDGDAGLASTLLQERDEDEEFISGFDQASQGNLLPIMEDEDTPVKVQTRIVWDDMMDFDE